MKYLLFYTEDCSPCVRIFITKKKALKFVKEFNEKYCDPEDADNWLDCLIRGSIKEHCAGMWGINIYE